MAIKDWLSDRTYVGMTPGPLDGLRSAVSAGVQEALSSPVFGDMMLPDGGDGGIGSIGTGQGNPGDWGIGPHNMGSVLSKIGTAGQVLTGGTGLALAGNMLGTLGDQIAVNQKLDAVGLPGLSPWDYAGSVIGNMLPGFLSDALAIRDPDQRMFDKMHQLGYTNYIGSEDESIGAGWNDFTNYIGDEDESIGYGWGNDAGYDGGPSHEGVGFDNSDDDNDFGW